MKCRRLKALTFRINNKGRLSGITAKTALTYLYFIYCVSHRFIMTNTYRTIIIGNKGHKILTGSYPKQCDAYHKAIENKDIYAAHMLHLPYVARDVKMIQFEIDMLAKKQALDEELERVNNLPKELLDLEIKMRFSNGG
jgi:hypothetical protein